MNLWLMMIDDGESIYLVGGFKSSEKYEFVNWDDYSKYMEK